MALKSHYHPPRITDATSPNEGHVHPATPPASTDSASGKNVHQITVNVPPKLCGIVFLSVAVLAYFLLLGRETPSNVVKH